MGLSHPYVRVPPAIGKTEGGRRGCGALPRITGETSGSDALVTLGEGVVGQVRLTHAAQEVGLESRAFADDGVDRLEVHQLLVADEACALAQCPVEGEADGLDATRGGPGVGDLVAALVLGGGGEEHVWHAGVGFVEGLPEQFMVVPVGSAGEDHHRAGGRVVFASLGCAGGEEVAGVDLAGGQAGGHAGAFHGREWTPRFDAVDLAGIVTHGFHRLAAVHQRLGNALRLFQFDGVDFRRVKGAGHVAELLGGFVFALLDALGGDVEAVDDAPDDVPPEFLHAGASEEVKDGADHHFHRAARGLRIGHVGGFGFVVDRELRHAALLGEGGVKAGDFDLLTVEGREGFNVGECLRHGDLQKVSCQKAYFVILVMTGGKGGELDQLVRDVGREAGSAGALRQKVGTGFWHQRCEHKARTDPG